MADSAADHTVVRSPSDILRTVVAAVILLVIVLVEWLFGDTLVTFTSNLLAGFSALPHWLVNLLVVGTRLVALAVLVVGVVMTAARSGRRMVLTVLVAAVAGAALALLLSAGGAEGESVVTVTVDLGPLSPSGAPTVAGLGAFAAALTAAAPWLARRWRRLGWLAVLGLVWIRFVTSAISFDSVDAALAGWLAGAVTLVVLGAPSRRPTATAIRHGLDIVGLPLATLDAAKVDARGSTPYFGSAADGSRYFVKALGTDQRSADLLFRMYRALGRRDRGDERPFSSLRRAVEHEAFVSLMARDLGVRTPRVRAMAEADPNAFVLAYDSVAGSSLDGVAPEQITDEVLGEIWEQMSLLRRHRIAHRDLRLANLFRADDGRVWMIDFGFSEIAASDLLLATDVAELVASSSVVVGPERAVAPARATVHHDLLVAAAERLKPWALSGATRAAMKQRPGALDDLAARLRSG